MGILGSARALAYDSKDKRARTSSSAKDRHAQRPRRDQCGDNLSLASVATLAETDRREASRVHSAVAALDTETEEAKHGHKRRLERQSGCDDPNCDLAKAQNCQGGDCDLPSERVRQSKQVLSALIHTPSAGHHRLLELPTLKGREHPDPDQGVRYRSTLA